MIDCVSPSIVWFSAGCTSAVAAKIATARYKDSVVYYIDTGSHHPDSLRFLHDCENWFGCHIHILSQKKFSSHWDVIEKTRYINGAAGARCTLELKKKVRYALEDSICDWNRQILGFSIEEQRRAKLFCEQYPKAKAEFPLIEEGLSKPDCLAILRKAGIKVPIMYELGFHNNNCIGCVKGGKGYWSAIRKYFPDAFLRMSIIEHEIGHSCINGCYLSDLPANYPITNPIVESCSLWCDVEFLGNEV